MNKLRKSTKLKILNSNVKSVLLYTSESLTITQKTLDRLQIYQQMLTNDCKHMLAERNS